MCPYKDNDDFEPRSEEELRQEEIARCVRREVIRIHSGEADGELEQEREQMEAQQEEERQQEERQKRRRSHLFWQLFSGNILLNRSIADHYHYMVIMGVMCFLSIAVLFTALYAEMSYSRAERELRLTRERSIRYQEQLYRSTTHAAISAELQRRGINLQDPRKRKEILEE